MKRASDSEVEMGPWTALWTPLLLLGWDMNPTQRIRSETQSVERARCRLWQDTQSWRPIGQAPTISLWYQGLWEGWGKKPMLLHKLEKQLLTPFLLGLLVF